MQEPAFKHRFCLEPETARGMVEVVGDLQAPLRSQAKSTALHRVADACLADALGAFGLFGARQRIARRFAGRLLATPVERLARRLLIFDGMVAEQGLQRAGAYALGQFTRGVTVQGLSAVPREGPLLVVANHPGLADAAALFAQLPRADLQVLAAPRRLLDALPAVHRRLITVPEAGRGRLSAVRDATRHMRLGGAVLTFPGGRIEPDPAVRPGAVGALARWSGCVDLFARRVPDLTIVPVAVSGVLSSAAMQNPLTRLRRDARDRDWLAATLQMLEAEPPDVAPTVVFGAPIRMADQITSGTARERVLATMRDLFAPPGADPSELPRTRVSRS
ncbi:phospholipid/glycerol acyltransferase [Salinisphaera dokdonensis CL-ES53]|uniref:Phospholipid/glycerol acyltransferase n=1 Tax=Salinisphaera dokdonensis CL-ES53 TaxID=1304272 RepID=A0ABV2B000_9GAMM